MSIYLDEKNPGKHKPFDDAAPDIVEYVRYLEVIAGKSANTAFSYYCDLRGFSRFMKRPQRAGHRILGLRNKGGYLRIFVLFKPRVRQQKVLNGPAAGKPARLL